MSIGLAKHPIHPSVPSQGGIIFDGRPILAVKPDDSTANRRDRNFLRDHLGRFAKKPVEPPEETPAAPPAVSVVANKEEPSRQTATSFAALPARRDWDYMPAPPSPLVTPMERLGNFCEIAVEAITSFPSRVATYVVRAISDALNAGARLLRQ